MTRIITYCIDAKSNDLKIRTYLHRLGYSHQNLIELKKDEGCVTVNGLPRLFSDQLREGDLLKVHIREHAAPNAEPSKIPVEIIYEDEDLLVVNKPAGMPVHPSFRNRDNTLANALVWYYARQGQPFVFRCSNRLDQDTSGLTIVSRHYVSASILSEMGARREICREYLAFVTGLITQPEGTINAPLGRKGTSLIEHCVDPAGGVPAITHYRVLSHYRTSCGALKDGVTLVHIQLETGRTHQIRVHMQSIGQPLLGDPLYGSPAPMISRQALHAFRLTFAHPITGEPLSFQSPMPRDMEQIIHTAHLL